MLKPHQVTILYYYRQGPEGLSTAWETSVPLLVELRGIKPQQSNVGTLSSRVRHSRCVGAAHAHTGEQRCGAAITAAAEQQTSSNTSVHR